MGAEGLSAEVSVSQRSDLAAARCPLDEALLYQEGLVDLLYRAGILAQRGGYRGEAHRAAVEFVDDGQQYLIVDLVESVAVDVECFESMAGDFEGDISVALGHGEVSFTA